MTWVLFVILLQADRYIVAPQGVYTQMSECFEAREAALSRLPDPKINYEVVCIKSDAVEIN